MSSQICVFVPRPPYIIFLPLNGNSHVGILLRNIWQLSARQASFDQLSLRSLNYPVPFEPWETLHERVVGSAHDNGWTTLRSIDMVLLSWCDPEKVHIYIHTDPPQDVPGVLQAAQNLRNVVWQETDLDSKLLDVSGDNDVTLKYVPKDYLDSLGIRQLGYTEDILLVRAEYDTALEEIDREDAISKKKYGVIITGQPGIGKSCFLYYLLLRLLNQKMPVAFELPHHFLVFHDDDVDMHPLNLDNPDVFPTGTWALSDSSIKDKVPCSAFRSAAKRGIAWIVQTTSPSEERWKAWKKELSASMYVMDYFSKVEMTALGKILNLNTENIQHFYDKWGPSARTCVWLTRCPEDEVEHEYAVERAARRFVGESASNGASVDAIRSSHILFSVRPKDHDTGGRKVLLADIATDVIRTIISYAAADVEA